MRQGRLTGTWAAGLLAAVALLGLTGLARADDAADLHALIERQRQRQRLEQQRQQIEQLARHLGELEQARDVQRPEGEAGAGGPAATPGAAPDPDAVKKVVGDYLQVNPGAGMPPSV